MRASASASASRSLGFFLGLLLVGVTARGQTRTAVADALFREARELMAAGNYARACPKFAESHRLDPATGTLLNLGNCYRKRGKTASSYLAFEEALGAARREKRNDRMAYAKKQIAELEPLLSFLTVRVGANARLQGLQVLVNGVELRQEAWGTSIPTDPGEVLVQASAPGRRAWQVKLELGAGADTQSAEVPLLKKVDVGATAPTPPLVPAKRSVAATADREPRMDTDARSPTLGYVVGGAGLVALGVGSYFGVQALSKWDDRNAHCDEDGCDADAVTLGDEASKYGYVADAGIGLGIVGIGIGTYLLLLPTENRTKSHVRIAPTVAHDFVGLNMGTVW